MKYPEQYKVNAMCCAFDVKNPEEFYHRDRSGQYASVTFQEALQTTGMVQSYPYFLRGE